MSLLADLPTRRQEDWKYLDLKPLAARDWQAADPAELDLKDMILPEARGSRLAFINGRFDPHHSANALPAALRFEAAPIDFNADGTPDPLHQLNLNHGSEGAVIVVPRNTKVDVPLHVLFAATGGGATFPRLKVVLEEGAEAELIEEYRSEGPSLALPRVEIHLEAGATLRHERIQRESPEAFHLGSLHATLRKNARYHSRTLTFGGRLSRQAPEVVLAEPGAESTLDGLALLAGDQVADTHSFTRHEAPHCVSRQLHKVIVDGESQAVFNGRVHVAPHAIGTDGRQQCRALLLSGKATVDAKPQLEIHADDVKCSHGAAIGQLEPEAVFYLQSRGLDETAARNLLTYGFAADLLAHLPVDSLRRKLRKLVMDRTQAISPLRGGIASGKEGGL